MLVARILTSNVHVHLKLKMVGHLLRELCYLLARINQSCLCNLQSPSLEILESGTLCDTRRNHALRGSNAEVLLKSAAPVSRGAAEAHHSERLRCQYGQLWTLPFVFEPFVFEPSYSKPVFTLSTAFSSEFKISFKTPCQGAGLSRTGDDLSSCSQTPDAQFVLTNDASIARIPS